MLHNGAFKGPVEARVCVDGAEVRLPMYAAELDEECLLGFDYLTWRGTCIDFGRKLVRVHSHEVLLLP